MIHRVTGWAGMQIALSRAAWGPATVGGLAFVGAMILFAPDEMPQNAYLCTFSGTLALALLHASSEEGLNLDKNRAMSIDNIGLPAILGALPGAVFGGVAELYAALLPYDMERAAYVLGALTGFGLFSAWVMHSGVVMPGRATESPHSS